VKNLITSSQLTPKIIERIFLKAQRFESGLKKGIKTLDILKGITVCTLFYEESTRTRFSFEKATHNLGGNIISTESASHFSSAHKGESLEHTIKVISNPNNPHLRYADIIVLRHPEKGAAQRAANVSGVPIINAGDGFGEHPTQALLDIYTFKKILGRLNNFNIAFVGDLRFSRIIKSDAVLLSKYPGIKMFFVSPKEFRIREELRLYLSQNNIAFEECNNIKTVIKKIDIAYIVRIQKNRLKGIKKILLCWKYERQKDNFSATKEIYEMSEKRGTFFCHPMPIDKKEKEISPEIENLSRVKIFEQAGYGVPVRMAILDILYKDSKKPRNE